MKIKKKWIILLVALAIVFTITACGNPGESVSKQSDDSTKNSKTTENTPSKKNVTLSFLSFEEAAIRDQYEVKFTEYAETFGIQIEISTSPVDQFPTILQTRVASGDAPDISNTWPGLSNLFVYARAGHLLDLSGQSWAPYLIDSVKTTVSVDGKVYGLPMGVDAIGVIYRKDLFKELGLEIPQTYEDFLTLCEKIKAAGKIPIAVGAKTDWAPQFIPDYTFCNNILYSKDPEWDNKLLRGEVSFSTTPEWKQVFEMYMDLIEKEYINKNPLGIDREQSIQMLVKGDALMMVDGSWIVSDYPDPDTAQHVGMFAMPAPAGMQTTVPVGTGTVIQAFEKTKYPDEVKAALEYMASKEVIMSLVYGKRMSAFTNMDTNVPEGIKEIFPALQEASYPFTNITWANGIQNALIKGYQEVMTGKSIDDMLKDVDAVATKSIEEFNKNN